MPSAEGNLAWVPLTDNPAMAAPVVALAADLVPRAMIAQIDPLLADTSEFCQAYDVAPEKSANCVIVAARRGDQVTYAAVVVLATDRADVNGVIRKELGARKASFGDKEDVEFKTDMVEGGITPIGLPKDWPVLIDTAVAEAGKVVVGGGVRGAKLLVDGADLAGLPTARVLDLSLPGG